MNKHLALKTVIFLCGFLSLPLVSMTITNNPTTSEANTMIESVNSELMITSISDEKNVVETNFKWTIMIYMAADNNLEMAGATDLNEMKYANFGSEVCLVVEFDGWDSCLIQEMDNINYNTTQRFRIPGAGGAFINLENGSEERNMGEAQTLSDFIGYSMNQYPADNYCLILWNHGLGWETGITDWRDYTSSDQRNYPILPQGLQRSIQTRQKNVCWDDRSFGDSLTEEEMQTALSEAPEPIDVIAFDACLMGCVEVAYAIRNYAQYMVASEDSLGLSGFYYLGFLEELGFHISLGIPTNYDPETCAMLIVEETIDNLVSTPELSMEVTQLGVIDLTQIQELSDYLADLAEVILNMNSNQITEVCTALTLVSEYSLLEQIDVWYVLQVIETISPGATSSFNINLRNQLEHTLLFQWFNTSVLTRCSGLTIYSPWSSDLWIEDYSDVSSFAKDTGWDKAVARMYNEAGTFDTSDTILSHDNPRISRRIEENEIILIFLSLHWNEKVTLTLSGPPNTDFDFYLVDFEVNLLGESYLEDYPETISYTAYEGAESFILIIHAYQGSGNFDLKATYSTSNALVEFIGCANMFFTDANNNTKIDDIQLVLAFDIPELETVTFQLQMIDHSDSFVLKWSQQFREGLEFTVLDLPYEALFQQIEALLPTQRWECLAKLSIIEPSNWQYSFQDTPLAYLVKFSDLDPPSNISEVISPGQIIEVEPLNHPRPPSSTPQTDNYDMIIMGVFGLAIVGGISLWIMRRRTKSAYRKTNQYSYSFKPTVNVQDIQYLAVCPSCGVVYRVQSSIVICPTCQVELQAIVK